jgi:hypothetical protein
MYPVTDRFRDAVFYSHTIATRCEVLTNNRIVHELAINSGNVDIDVANAIRRSMSASLVDPTGELVPSDVYSLLAPRGNEIRLWRGFQYPDGTTEMASLGIFGISNVDVADYGEGLEIQVNGYDRSRSLRRSRFLTAYVIPAGTNVTTAIEGILRIRTPWLSYRLDPTDYTTPRLVLGIDDETKDPLDACIQLANSAGMEFYIDSDGEGRLTDRPDYYNTSIDWRYEEGDLSTILGINRTWDDEKTYNHVVVTGESSTGSIVRAEAMDTDPSSPTYYRGRFGDVVYFFSSKFITTLAQAKAVASLLLRRVLGTSELVRFPAIVNPAHDVGDLVAIRRGASKVDSEYVISSLAIPLGAGDPMQATTHEKRLFGEGIFEEEAA